MKAACRQMEKGETQPAAPNTGLTRRKGAEQKG